MAISRVYGLTNPMMQEAYLRRVNKASGLGFVNPQLKGRDYVQSVSASESQRLRSLDEAGQQRALIKQMHDEDLSYKNKVLDYTNTGRQADLDYKNALLNIQADQMQSARRGSNVALGLGLAQVGLGAWDAYKTREEAVATKVDNRNKLVMQLSYLKKTNPEMYSWYLNQPYIATKLKRYGVI